MQTQEQLVAYYEANLQKVVAKYGNDDKSAEYVQYAEDQLNAVRAGGLDGLKLLWEKGALILRAEYMAGNVTHDEYYVQFCNDQVIQLVTRSIGRDKILASQNEHFNDIPLAYWDSLSGLIRNAVGTKLAKANGDGFISLSDTVCVAKRAAKIIKNNC